MILVDTHVLIWEALTPERLSQSATEAVVQESETGRILVSDISLWEIAMLIHMRRLKVDADPQSFILLILHANDVDVRPITPQSAALSVQLPDSINRDPADRLIVATALVEDVPLVTADRNLRSSGIIQTIW